MNQELLTYISKSPTQFQAMETSARMLLDCGAVELHEEEKWELVPGKTYFTSRNGSSLIAWKMLDRNFSGYLIEASHLDSPYLKIKENAEEEENGYIRLSVERYGGMLLSTWLDRPLSVAGRITVKTENGFELRTVDLREPVAIIPNLAPHLNDKANKDITYNPAVDMLPLYGESAEKGTFLDRVAKAAKARKDDIFTCELYLYNPQPGMIWNSYVSSPRLDDLQCAFCGLKGFLAGKPSGSIPVLCLFDNEEVGSRTKQGADSTFLPDVLERIADALGLSKEEQKARLAQSFMVSADNAHALHPNHTEIRDPNHTVRMNEGIVIKYNASQSYASDGLSAAVFQLVCEHAGVPFQRYANRADMRGGGTLGNISTSHVSIPTVDIGLAQLAMHSSYETAGLKDTEYLVKAFETYFSSTLTKSGNNYSLI